MKTLIREAIVRFLPPRNARQQKGASAITRILSRAVPTLPVSSLAQLTMGTPAPGCNGTVYNILKQGSGAEVVKGAKVTVHATGMVPCGKQGRVTAGQRGPSGRFRGWPRLGAAPGTCGAGEACSAAPFWPNLGGLVF